MPLWLSQPMVTGDFASGKSCVTFVRETAWVPSYFGAKNWNILFFLSPTEALHVSTLERLFLLVSVWCPIFCSSFKIRQIMQPHWLSLLDDLGHTKNVCPHCVRWVTNKAVILPFRDVGSIPHFMQYTRGGYVAPPHHQTTSFPPSLYCQGQARFYWSVLKGSLAFSAGKRCVWRGNCFQQPVTHLCGAVKSGRHRKMREMVCSVLCNYRVLTYTKVCA